MTNVKERLLQYIKSQGINKEDFFEIVGLSYSNFKGIQKNSGLNSDSIVKILSIYSNINLYWLILGDGDMLVKNDQQNEIKEPIAKYNTGTQSDKDKIISLLEDQVRDLKKDKELLYNIIKNQKQ